jgi:hypothetical protein
MNEDIAKEPEEETNANIENTDVPELRYCVSIDERSNI